MKKLLICIALCLAMIACGNSEKLMTERQDVTEVLNAYDGFSVRSKTRHLTEDGYICTLQLTKTANGKRYDCYIDSLPGWVWDEYELDDTIHAEIIYSPEPEEQDVTEDSTGKKTIVIDGVVYELTERAQ